MAGAATSENSAAHISSDTHLVERVHASCVAYDGRAVLITGKSGAGKSSLALALINNGARLVADDQTVLIAEPEGIIATAPAPLVGKIEVRGVGIVRSNTTAAALVALCVDLDQTEDLRLPQNNTISRLGVTLPLLKRMESPSFPLAILQILSSGRCTV